LPDTLCEGSCVLGSWWFGRPGEPARGQFEISLAALAELDGNELERFPPGLDVLAVLDVLLEQPKCLLVRWKA
jgi:hypothetical protein